MNMLRKMHFWHWSLALLLALGALLLMQSVPARAETITVTNTLDDGSAGSLRAAIAAANPGATIVFSDTLAGQTITLTTQLEIAQNLTISGTVPITVSGNHAARVFNIAADVAVTLHNLTIARGEVYGDSGGGIRNQGALTVTNCTLDDNLAWPAPYSGGGIYNADSGVLTVISSTFTNNGAAGAGAGMFNAGAAQVQFSTFSNGGSGYASSSGAGIANLGVLTVTHSLFTGNHAPQGAGLSNGDLNSRLTVSDCTFSNNVAANGGAGMDNYGAAFVHNSLFSANQADGGDGGGIYNAGTLQVTESTLSANSALAGGGLYNADGTVTVAASLFVSNTATAKGGGLYTHGGTATVLDSTLAHNRTTHTTLADGYGGGGLYNNGSSLNVQNSTIANNAAPYNTGGGLYNATSNTSMATVVQASTISGNSAGYVGGVWNESGNLELRQTIVANSSGGYDCGKGMDSGYVSSVASLFEATGWAACGDDHYYSILGVDPLLGPLADNGGKTPTFALLPDSPAIDAVSGWSCLSTDQRGAPRNDLACDIGAFELQHADSDTVIKSGMTAGKQASFGSTRVRVTVTGGDAGTITATKHLITPGGLYDTGEIMATWWLTASHSPFTATLSFCYTPEEIAGLNEADLRAFRWDGSVWDGPFGSAPTGGCVTVADVTAFSAWTLFDTSKGSKPTAARVVALAAWGFAPIGILFIFGGAVIFARRRRAQSRWINHN
jgi:hypothetical protein